MVIGTRKSRTIWMNRGSFSMPSSIVTKTTLSVSGTRGEDRRVGLAERDRLDGRRWWRGRERLQAEIALLYQVRVNGGGRDGRGAAA